MGESVAESWTQRVAPMFVAFSINQSDWLKLAPAMPYPPHWKRSLHFCIIVVGR